MVLRMTASLALSLLLGLLSGCARTARLSAPAQAAEPDCSFRTATSCWTLAARFPTKRAEPSDSQPRKILNSLPAALASHADSARRPQ
jgi:hypothetical protein